MNYKILYGYKIYEDGTVISKKTGKPFKQHLNGRGYPIIAITVSGKRITKAVHRLVAEAFIPKIKNKIEVDHRDGDKLNNHVSNLRWVTRGENIKHAYTLNKRSATGENNARCKISENTVIEICELLESGYSAVEIRDLGYCYSRVRSIKSRQNWKYISKHYSW